MRTFLGIDLGSTTTKAVLLDEDGGILGRGITNSRSNYHLAADIARDEAFIGARFALLQAELRAQGEQGEEAERFQQRLQQRFRREQQLSQVRSLREQALREVAGPRLQHLGAGLRERLERIFDTMEEHVRRPRLNAGKRSDFFRDQAASEYSKQAEQLADREISFEELMSVFDKAIITVENDRVDLTFEAHIRTALKECLRGQDESSDSGARFERAVVNAAAVPLEQTGSIGTGYGRQRLPFPKESIRSEILCHGLGAHAAFPKTATVLDIGGQDTKAIQVDPAGIVTSFQMNDRCAAGCGRYLGYIADEMNMGVHELGPLAMMSSRHVKINSTCTVFAGAELRDRLTMGQRREDILAGLHRAIILRAMALLSRSGGVADEFTFTGGVANNQAAVAALRQLVAENYGQRTLNISPDSIYTGALGAAIFAHRAHRAHSAVSHGA